MENISITQYKHYFIFKGGLEYCSQIVSWKRFRYLHFETPLCKYISFPSLSLVISISPVCSETREKERYLQSRKFLQIIKKEYYGLKLKINDLLTDILQHYSCLANSFLVAIIHNPSGD